MTSSVMNASSDVLGESSNPIASSGAIKMFIWWTAFWWGGTGICAMLFFFGAMDFVTSTKIPLYGVCIWLNGCLIPFFLKSNKGRDKMAVFHDALVIWMLSYMLTNLLWEIPWVILSPHVFENLHTIDDVVAQTAFMRESIFNMYWWVIASFSCVDLRTVNHDPTFYTLEIYAFINIASIFYFFHLHKKRSPFRYLVPILGSGEPVASTFIFSFTEVFADFENMVGGMADTLLALVWSQYQYIVFPLLFGYLGVKMLLEDWKYSQKHRDELAPVYN